MALYNDVLFITTENHMTISLKRLLMESHVVDELKIKAAYLFFIKHLKLPKARMSLKWGHLDVDSDTLLPTQAQVFVSKKRPHRYEITMRNNNPMSGAEQVRHLAHEMQHVYQIESGRFDVYGSKWDNVVYSRGSSKLDYVNLPWEQDARSSVDGLEIEFNRYMREAGAKRKITKI